MARDIHEVEVFRADELHGRALEEPVVLFADIRRILDRLARNLVHVRARADDPDCARAGGRVSGEFDLRAQQPGAP